MTDSGAFFVISGAKNKINSENTAFSCQCVQEQRNNL